MSKIDAERHLTPRTSWWRIPNGMVSHLRAAQGRIIMLACVDHLSIYISHADPRIAKMEQVFYAAIYQKGAQSVVMTDQKEPIPVPVKGSPIEVFETGGATVIGTVDSVGWDVRREVITPQVILRRWTMRVTII